MSRATDRLTAHVPEQHQSMRPPVTMIWMLIGVVVLVVVIAVGVTLAIRHGGDSCSSRGQQTHATSECR